MKAHIGVDSATKVIHSVVATAANVADCTILPDLLPLLQEIDTQHPLQPYRPPPIAGLRVDGSIRLQNSAHGTTASTSARKTSRRVVLA
jgi:hypothetical protein